LPVDVHVPEDALTGAGLRGVAEEQAALRRVATLVAGGARAEDVFAAVTEEVGQLFGVDFAIMGRYEGDETVTSVAASGAAAAGFPVGSRWGLDGSNLVTIVLETRRPSRVDRFEHASGTIGVAGREAGFHSTVGTPILVEGRVWGLIAVGRTQLESSLPGDTEARLAQFTELSATAIANAGRRAELARLAEQQAALRRVATLVARGTAPEEVFTAVIDAVGQLFEVDYAGMARYEPGGMATAVAARGTTHFPVGSSMTLGGKNTATLVFETGRPVRIDGYADASGPMGHSARERGVRSSVAAPIIVEGRLWGTIGAGSTGEEPLPQDTEARLADFTELVATAIANAESRAGLARLANEQAALRRIATLVARGVPPKEVFAAVTDEVERLLPIDYANMARYEPDDAFTILASAGGTTEHFAAGSRLRLDGTNLATIVFETGGPARIDNYADAASGEFGAIAREAGVCSAVGAPIMVEGRLWGLIAVGSIVKPSLPADTDARLAGFTELVATAIANADSRAALAASRVRIVAAADASRRRIERDLHDGAQERLVNAVIVLKLALRALSNADANAEDLVAEALRHAEQANAELRELAHGILPAALTRGGLQAGLEALVSRVSLPVSVDVPAERLPAGVEATAYFVVSEALTNVVKHARARGAVVTARLRDGQLVVEIRDDGVGGARGDHGTGLEGLQDRVSALDGRLVIESPPGGGTRVRALLPVADQV
jgi:signal transduction histidine kinase